MTDVGINMKHSSCHFFGRLSRFVNGGNFNMATCRVGTFLMAWHLAISECPIILSGEQILMKGNWESSAILAASAVFPLFGGPEGDHQSPISCLQCVSSLATLYSGWSCVRPTFQEHRHQRRAVAVLCLLDQELPVPQHRGHRVAPPDDPVHDVAGVVLLIGPKRLDGKTHMDTEDGYPFVCTWSWAK